MTTRRFRIAALAAALSAWALVAVGGVVRVTESGLGCPDWPLCSGRPIPRTTKTAVLEYSHRFTALVVTVLVVLVAVLAWRSYRSRRDIIVPALTAAIFIPFQALLGAIVVWLELPSSLVGIHFVVGMVFLAATVVTAARAFRGVGSVASDGFARLAWATTGIGFLLVTAGAVVVSAHADEACGEQWPACNGAFVAGGGDAAAQVVHRTLAYVVAGLAVCLLVLALRGRGPRIAGALPFLAVAGQIALGISLVLVGDGTSAHAPLDALHVAGSGAVWASLVALAALCPPKRRATKARPAIVTAARAL